MGVTMGYGTFNGAEELTTVTSTLSDANHRPTINEQRDNPKNKPTDLSTREWSVGDLQEGFYCTSAKSLDRLPRRRRLHALHADPRAVNNPALFLQCTDVFNFAFQVLPMAHLDKTSDLQ
jgi:hypothetical protein